MPTYEQLARELMERGDVVELAKLLAELDRWRGDSDDVQEATRAIGLGL